MSILNYAAGVVQLMDSFLFLPTGARPGETWVSRCCTTSCSSGGPRLSWFRSTGGLRQRATFSRAMDRFPARSEAVPQACHTPLGSRPLLVDTCWGEDATRLSHC